jgi:hypothetical protein
MGRQSVVSASERRRADDGARTSHDDEVASTCAMRYTRGRQESESLHEKTGDVVRKFHAVDLRVV